jgi:putative ABC transport system ATP-binding protein
MIRVEGVCKYYGSGPARVDALRELNLSIARGEFVSIMGPSGSGKSTLLNLLAALDRPSAGNISIAGHDITRKDDDALTLFRRDHIGLIFQFFNLLPTLTAFDNVMLPVMLARRQKAPDRERAQRLLEAVGLAGRARHFTFELSGGEMQRVAIARALMLNPELILADEPTGNLDSATGSAILGLMQRVRVEHGTTIVMVTHDRSAAETGDRIVTLKDGEIVVDEPVSRSRASGARSLG